MEGNFRIVGRKLRTRRKPMVEVRKLRIEGRKLRIVESKIRIAL